MFFYPIFTHDKINMAALTGVEPVTSFLEGKCSAN